MPVANENEMIENKAHFFRHPLRPGFSTLYTSKSFRCRVTWLLLPQEVPSQPWTLIEPKSAIGYVTVLHMHLTQVSKHDPT